MIEVFSPGLIIPGALGAISFLLGLYGSSQLPVTLAGVALLVLGVALIVAEAHVTAGGLLGIAGVIAVAVSGLLLYDTESDAFEVSAPVVIVAGLALAAMLACRDPQGGPGAARAGAHRLGGDDRRDRRGPPGASARRPGVRRGGAVAGRARRWLR